MTMTCDRLRALLEEHGLEGLQTNEAGRAHAAECDGCFALLEAFPDVDRALSALPAIDAPDALVERVLAAPKPAIVPISRARRFSRRLLGAGAIAASLLVGLFSVTMTMTAGRDAPELRVKTEPSGAESSIREDIQVEAGKHEIELQKEGYFAYSGRGERTIDPNSAQTIVDGKAQNGAFIPEKPPESPAAAELPSFGEDRVDHLRRHGDIAAASQLEARLKEQGQGRFDENKVADGKSRGPVATPPATKAEKGNPVEQSATKMVELKRQLAEKNLAPATRRELELEYAATGEELRAELDDRAGRANRRAPAAHPEVLAGLDLGVEAAQRFWHERDQLQGLAYQAAEGYWLNTYTPGDPTYRMLAAKLSEEGIEDAAQPYVQPFDAPRNAALAVSMTSDRAAVEGETRVLMQVGLKGAPEYGRRRPTMNLALVVDAEGDVEMETAKAMRSLVMSFAQSKQAGDRLALYIAGKPGARTIEPKRFEYGAVAVAMQEAFSGRVSDGHSMSTTEAMQRAIEMVAGADDETAPLGASAVILMTHRPVGMEIERLAQMAHQSAVAGIAVTAVGVGRRVSVPELDRVALAGQGNRRLLSGAEGADEMVEDELSSVSRVVARAVRLRIRLAPGVKLVNVFGSRRLDTMESQRVREAEKSIDLRLSRHFGIEADRGEDEDGIQIVIPSYYAKDEHPILLDVVVPGPGPVADVQVRYKDLVYLKNGVARARLELRRGRTERGPLQTTVLKNLVSQRISEALATASQKLAHGDVSGARADLSAAHSLIEEVSKTFIKDRELARDSAMIARYLQVTTQPDAGLIESMHFASKAKILPAASPSQR